jgi:hypothetical protein
MKFLTALIFVLSFLPKNAPAFFEKWEGFSSPEIMLSGFISKFDQLPLEGNMEGEKNAWSGHYWPSKEGGINNRWNSKKREGFDYKSPKKEVILKMSTEQLKTLSPAEKFDLLKGRYSYPLKKEATGTASKFAYEWAGICHGWAPASLYHNEPTPKVLTNPEGLKIPFGSADIKALLSYYYAFYNESATNQVGLRCYFGGWLGGARGCDNDLNAGAFHIIMTNRLGIHAEGFLMDKERFRQVWNQPVVGYKSKITADNLKPKYNAASSAVREIRVETDLMYVDESDPTWDIAHGTTSQKIAVMELQYRLEINSRGEIVGGDWESDERPDFIWEKQKINSFQGLLTGLEQLLDD